MTMDSNSYKKFLFEIQHCSDQRLREFYDSIVDEMEKRSWEKMQISDLVETISELESDWV